MADLEEISRSENSNSNKAAEKISSYLAADVNVMVDFFESKQFKSFLNDMCDFSKSFNIPLSQLIYSPKKIQSSQNIVYFNETGIYYNQVYRKDKKSQDKRQKKKNSFNRRLNNFFDRNNKIGLFENVHQCYLPYGFFLRKIISKKLSPSESLFSIKSNDNQRRFYLSKFANTLSERILIDYEDYHFKKNSNEDEVILRKARNKIKGKYNTTVEEIQENMNKMKELIENWIKENNLKLIHQEGSYLYIQGGNEETYLRSNKAPVVNVSSLEKILLTKGKPNGKIYFQKGEILNGMKISSQPTYFHNIFEMETYGHFLNQLLSGNIREALNELYFSCDSLLSAKIEPKKLFWKNKSADFYSAFSKGSKINFSSKYEGEIKSDINGNYVESNGDRIYLLNQNQIQIDWDKYITRNEEKLKEFLFPLIGESYLKFTRPIEEVGTIKEKEFDNMESEINFNLKKMLLV